ncbi:MAG: proline dehydrogenase family protein, partial [Planctomycetia bacterium]
MSTNDLNQQIIECGKEFFKSIQGEKPSLFNKKHWTGKVMDRIMQSEDFKVQLFRFVDVFPYLNTTDSLTRHIREYFGDEKHDVPDVLRWGAKASGWGGKLGGAILNKAISFNIKDFAKQFIVGSNAAEAVRELAKIRNTGYAFILDILGEAAVCEPEADVYMNNYIDLLDSLQRAQATWTPLTGGAADDDLGGNLDWGYAKMINVAVKPTSLYSKSNPRDFEGSVNGIFGRLSKIYEKVIEAGGTLCIDMESYKHKEITLELFRRMRMAYPDYPHLEIVLQAYLRDSEEDLQKLLAFGREKNLPFSIRLVKGAYWDYETVLAKQNGWPIPVYTVKAESDATFERMSRTILENHDLCYFSCASHNVRSIAATLQTARSLGVPEDRYEFQVLYGMAEPVRKGLMNVAKRLRLYCPYGEMIPGMAYLVRRLLENTSNQSFLRQSFAEEASLAKLLQDPQETIDEEALKPKKAKDDKPSKAKLGTHFNNEPMVDFTRESARDAFPKAIQSVREQLGQTYPLWIDGQEVTTDEKMDSVNPADPSEVIGSVCQAGVAEVDRAIAAAKRAFPAWRDTPPAERAEYLNKAANLMRKQIYEMSARQTLEVGKQWDQAYADVCEAIDFLDYYAQQMRAMADPIRCGTAPGEVNRYFYEPKGIAAVIAPWNFPLAIACGMVSAAIVTGNPVVFKPSGLSSVLAYDMVNIFREVGLPDGVFNYCPGRGSVIGDHLVDHPDISLIAFTGSMEVGLRILERAAKVYPDQPNVKKVVCEMGGKNAIIIDDDADLDEAIPHVIYSAFGFQGQKCSACSRVIVLDAIYDRFIERLIEAAKSMQVGPAEDSTYDMGPVVDSGAQKTILDYAQLAKEEG